MSGFYYLSYADDVGFRGACIVRGRCVVTAGFEARRLGISPGGQVLGAHVPKEELPAEQWRNRLLTEQELKQIWPDAASLAEHEAAEEQ